MKASPLGALLLALLPSFGIAQVPGLPLQIINPGSATWDDEPVSFGVPFPGKDTLIYDAGAASLTVMNATGQVVPHQFRVLSRWHGDRNDVSKPIKWALVSFLADCPAGGNTQYYLSVGPSLGGQISVQETPSVIEVTTRPGTTFTIGKSMFSVLDRATVDGSTVVNSPGSLLFTDPSTAPIQHVVSETVFEEWGSVRLVVRQRGTFSNDLKFTCRWYFYTGQSSVTMDFRLENPGAYGVFFNTPSAHRYFDQLYFRLPVAGSGAAVATHGGTKVLNGQAYRQTQDCPPLATNDLAVLTRFDYSEHIGATQVNAGDLSPGVIDVQGSSGGVSAVIEDYWQNFPKSVRFENQALLLGLWPEFGHGPEYRGQYGGPNDPIDPMALANYRFEGGRWKSYRVVLDFHTGGLRTASELTTLADGVNRPAAGRPWPVWTKRTQAVGWLFSDARNWGSPGLDRVEQHHNGITNDAAATDQPSLGRIGLNAFRNRGGTYGGKQFFGWDNFGDIHWAEGYASLHYDWTSSFLLDWYRGGPYSALDMGREMAWHRRDYDQNHSTTTVDFWRGCQYYEKGEFHGNYRFGEPSHNWLHGVLLHYAITGEEGSREAAIENLAYCLRKAPGNWNGAYGIRIPGWTIDNLVDGYNYLGNPLYLSEAGRGVELIKTYEQMAGGLGHLKSYSITNPTAPGNATPWMHNLFFIAAVKYVIASGDTTDVDLLLRMKSWFHEMVVPATGTRSNCTLPMVYDSWDPVNPATNVMSNHLVWPMMESLTYAFALFENTNDYAAAAGLFDVITRYHQAPTGSPANLDNAAQWSPIGMRMLQFPGSESKIIGNILRWSYAMPAVYSWLSGSW